MSAIYARTSRYNFQLVNFDWSTWHEFEWSNWKSVEAILWNYITTFNVTGAWQNSFTYSVGQRAIDTDGVTGVMYECLVGHTSAAVPTTFATDRAANPTYWQLASDFDTLNATLSAISLVAPVADKGIYFTSGTTAASFTLTGFARTLLDDVDAATMRATLGLDSMALQASGAVAITGGSISGVTFSSANVTITGGTITGITDLVIADGGTGASTATAARQNLGTLGIERLAKTTAYTVANADKTKLIACGTAPWTLTFNAASGYDADFNVHVTNESTTRAILMSISGGTNFWLYPGQTAFVYNDNNVWKYSRPERWKLTGNITIYVDGTNGSDSNDGLASGTGNALLTFAAAVTLLCSDLDFNTKTVTVQVANGTYTSPIAMSGTQNWVGGGFLDWKGDTATPSNVIISITSAHCINLAGEKSGLLKFEGFKFTTTTAGHGIQALEGTVFHLGVVEFGSTAWSHCAVQFGAKVYFDANYTISGGASIHWECDYHGSIQCTSKTVTLTGTPNFTNQFCRGLSLGIALVSGNTFSGSATGTRYLADANSVINTGGGGATYLPGNAAGSVTNGGQYV